METKMETKKESQIVKPHTECRVCGGALHSVYDFGPMPLANALADTKEAAINSPRYPQELMHCGSCNLGQLSVVVAPEILYADYVYKSSVSRVFREHCAGLAKDLLRWAGSRPYGAQETRSFQRKLSVIDIAGNDGAMVRELLKQSPNVDAYVVDVAQTDEEAPYTKVHEFWSEATARTFREKFGRVDAVIAQNVVGHVDDVAGFFRAVFHVLKEDGVFIVEVPSYELMLRTGAFDTVYHEHLSYWSFQAMCELANDQGFTVQWAKVFPEIHCGTFRFWLNKKAPACDIPNPVKHGPNSGDFTEFRAHIDRTGKLVRSVLSMFPNMAGVTASAKSNVILNQASGRYDSGLRYLYDSGLLYLVDDAETKQGKFVPGVGLEVKPFTSETVQDLSAAVILSRNLTGSMADRLRSLGFTGLVVSV